MYPKDLEAGAVDGVQAGYAPLLQPERFEEDADAQDEMYTQQRIGVHAFLYHVQSGECFFCRCRDWSVELDSAI